jgi:hypothetical protein
MREILFLFSVVCNGHADSDDGETWQVWWQIEESDEIAVIRGRRGILGLRHSGPELLIRANSGWSCPDIPTLDRRSPSGSTAGP